MKHHSIASALIQYGYIPRATKHADEIPPIFTAVKFTPRIAQMIAAQKLRPGQGYDVVRHNATRHNHAIRALSLPHPAPYAHLAISLTAHWDKFKHIATNRRNRARPASSKGSRRFAMIEAEASPSPSYKHRYVAMADIGQFYDSIYTHALAWALVGQATAKKTAFSKPSPWYNDLDKLLRASKRNETTGVLIGPATSAIVGDALLTAVDAKLGRFSYTRFVDDYVAFCESETEAIEFVNALRNELSALNLSLNPRKTRIRALPVATTPKWIRELRRLTPSRLFANPQEITDILDEAIELVDDDIDTSALIWALRAAEPSFSSLTASGKGRIIGRLLHLSARRAPVVPFLCRFYDLAKLSPSRDRLALISILRHHLSEGRSDVGLWLTYLLLRNEVSLGPNLIRELINHGDPLTITLMATSKSEPARQAADRFARQLLRPSSDDYERDRNWILLYELYRLGRVDLGTYADHSFETLKSEGVSFIQWERRRLLRTEVGGATRFPFYGRGIGLVEGGSPN